MVVIAALGFAISVVIESVHRRLDADLTYASFCNVNNSVNCDVVLSSDYAELAGVSVSLLAAVYHLALFVAAIAVMRSGSASRRQTLSDLIFAAACVGFAFSFYLGVIAVVVLHAICLLCGGLYVVSIGMLVAAWLLRHAEQRTARKASQARANERRIWMAGAAALIVLIVVVIWEAMFAGRSLSAAEIRQQRPDYYRHFQALPRIDVPVEGGKIRGPADAGVTIVEFSDFGCTHCAAFDERIGDVMRRGGDVRLVFRYFPLDSKCNPAISGPPSGERCMAAAAAECASEQEKFWQYARTLFEHQPNFSTPELRRYAEMNGLDMARFDSCLSRDDVHARIAADAKLGVSHGVRSTPTLFLNGIRIEGDPGANLGDALVLARERH